MLIRELPLFRTFLLIGLSFFISQRSLGQLPQNPDWTEEAVQDTQLFGDQLSMKGDMNGDGYKDLVVGAPRTDSASSSDNGSAYLYLGSDTGLAHTAAWSFTCDSGDAFFGGALSYAGDVDDDGYDDLIVGAPRMDSGMTDRGRAYLFRGDSTGLADTASWTFYGREAYGEFGISVSTAGDVNDDGFDDVIIGAHHEDSMATDAGRAYLFRGSSTGLEDTASWVEGVNETNAEFGGSVSQAGDVNGDGYPDVVVGCPKKGNGSDNFGRAYFYYGSPSGLPESSSYWLTPSVASDAQFGRVVTAAGDIDDDGYDDVVVGTDGNGAGPLYASGKAWSLHGGPSGIQYPSSLVWEFGPDDNYMRFADDLANAGDVNGDGHPDLIVGATGHASDRGKLYLFTGSDTGYADLPASTYEGTQIQSYMGTAVDGADVNGDAAADIAVGAHRYTGNFTDGGRAFLFMNACAKKPPEIATTPSEPCKGDSVVLDAGSGYASYAWSNSDSTRRDTVLLTDTAQYSVETVGDSGCVGQDMIELTVIDPHLTGLDTSYCLRDDPVSLSGDPSGGTFSGPGVSGNSFDPDAAGTGVHTIAYSYAEDGCTESVDSTTTVKECATSIASDRYRTSLDIHPVPTKGRLILEHPGDRKWAVELRDLEGRVLRTFELRARTDRTERDIASLADGIYLLRFQGDGREKLIKLVKR